MGQEYLYRFDGIGQIRSQSEEVWRPTATTSLDGVRTTTWLGPFGRPERDLLRVMAATLEADRLSPRRPAAVKRLQRDLGVYELMAFEHHAATLRSCRSFDDLVDMDPDARFATSLPIIDLLNEASAARAVFAMYQRYAAEIQEYLGAARPTVASRSRQPRKERDSDLFSAVG
jgi:hypothetical protein